MLDVFWLWLWLWVVVLGLRMLPRLRHCARCRSASCETSSRNFQELLEAQAFRKQVLHKELRTEDSDYNTV